MTNVLRISLCSLCVLGLVACSGATGPVQQQFDQPLLPQQPDPNIVPQPPAPSQQAPGGSIGNTDPLDDFGTEPPDEVEADASTLLETLQLTEDVDTTLTGLVVVTDATGDQRVIVRRNGVYTFADEHLTLGDLGVTLSTDIPGAFVATSSMFQTDGPGLVGFATPLADMPLSGSATFTGGAAGFVITAASGFDLTNGQSLVSVDFGTGGVTTELSGFTDVSQVSGNILSAPLAEIIWRNAQINGAGFSGGTLETLDGFGDAIDLTGPNTTLQAEGQFFGVNDSVTGPSEVGGLIFAEGENGKVYGSFIAD